MDMIPDTTRENVFYYIPRDVDGIECKCGGFAKRVKCTAREAQEFGCGRDTPGNECCARAFECKICKTRITGAAEAPEME